MAATAQVADAAGNPVGPLLPLGAGNTQGNNQEFAFRFPVTPGFTNFFITSTLADGTVLNHAANIRAIFDPNTSVNLGEPW